LRGFLGPCGRRRDSFGLPVDLVLLGPAVVPQLEGHVGAGTATRVAVPAAGTGHIEPADATEVAESDPFADAGCFVDSPPRGPMSLHDLRADQGRRVVGQIRVDHLAEKRGPLPRRDVLQYGALDAVDPTAADVLVPVAQYGD